jgi:hypothetical protein
MQATHEAELDIPALPKAARHIYIVPELADKTLLSVSQLCKANCQVVFQERAITVHHNGKVVMKGEMTEESSLWHMEVPTEKERDIHFAANTAIYFNTAAEIVKFMHAAMGYPVLTTLDKALAKGLVKGFPGLTQQTLRNHPPFSDATIKGHMAQTRKNVRSTKKSQQKRDGKAENPSSQNEPNPTVPNATHRQAQKSKANKRTAREKGKPQSRLPVPNSNRRRHQRHRSPGPILCDIRRTHGTAYNGITGLGEGVLEPHPGSPYLLAPGDLDPIVVRKPHSE